MHAQTQALTKANPEALHMALFLSVLAVAIYMLIIAPAFATTTPMGVVLCNIVNIVYGNLGRGLATLAVIVVGVGATLGKVSWGLAITVAVGIAVVFNASTIVTLLGTGAGTFSGC